MKGWISGLLLLRLRRLLRVPKWPQYTEDLYYSRCVYVCVCVVFRWIFLIHHSVSQHKQPLALQQRQRLCLLNTDSISYPQAPQTLITSRRVVAADSVQAGSLMGGARRRWRGRGCRDLKAAKQGLTTCDGGLVWIQLQIIASSAQLGN